MNGGAVYDHPFRLSRITRKHAFGKNRIFLIVWALPKKPPKKPIDIKDGFPYTPSKQNQRI